MKKVGNLSDEDNTGAVCREAYDNTLSKHHPFVIRKGAQIAMYTLPTRGNLLKKVCGGEEEIQRNITILPNTLEATDAVYNRIEALYTTYDLHSLP